MNENMRFSTFKPLNNFSNIAVSDDQNSLNSTETSSGNLNAGEIHDHYVTSSEPDDPSVMDELNHLSYIDSQTSELLCVEKADDLNNTPPNPLLYKPNTGKKYNVFTVNDKEVDLNLEHPTVEIEMSIKNTYQESDIDEISKVSEIDINSATISKKSKKRLSPIKPVTEVLPSNKKILNKNEELNEFFKSKTYNKNTFSSESLHKTKIETIEMYRDTLLKTKDAALMFDFAVFLLKTGLENYEDNVKISKKIIKEGCYYLKKMTIKGNVDAQYLLGDVYSNDTMKCMNLKQSRLLFETAAKKGHPPSAHRAAVCYEKGIGVNRDSRKALTFFKFAASRNHTQSMHKLGLFYFKGQMGVSKSILTQQNGINWLSRAVAKGDNDSAEAAYELGKIYERGFLDIIIPDINYAVSLYLYASSMGHTKSNTKLGQIYEKSDKKFIKQNIMLSIHYYTIASSSIDPDSNAQLKLSFFNLLGITNLMEPNLKLAFFWAEKAALLRNLDAEYTLGYFYEKGIGCSRNVNEANKWFKLALQHGNIQALKKIKQKDNDDGINDSTTGFDSDVYSEKNFSYELSQTKNKIINYLKRKKPNFDNNDTNKISSYSSVPNTKNVNPKYYSTTISFVETAVIPQLIHSIDNQNEKTFLYSKRLRKIFKPL